MSKPTDVQSEALGFWAGPRGRRRARWALRIGLLVVAVVLVASGTRGSLVVPALSPLLAVASLLTTWQVSFAASLGLLVGIVCLFRRRWFCRWVCPSGTCADAASHAGLRLGRRCPKRLPRLGSWLAMFALGGAALGGPLLLWFDPLAIFCGALSIWHDAGEPIAWGGTIGAAAVLLISFLWPGAWCARLCPLGATQDLLASAKIVVRKATGRAARTPVSGTRRALLGAILGVGWAALVRPRRSATAAPPIRPPGAVDETTFVDLCVRCGNCLRACPVDILRLDSGAGGLAGLMTPLLSFAKDYCREDCTACTQVCPSGALVALVPERKLEMPIGLARVDMDVCLLGEDRECSACRTWCPYEAITYVFSEDTYSLVPQIASEKCPGCGACERVCPTEPKAIKIQPR